MITSNQETLRNQEPVRRAGQVDRVGECVIDLAVTEARPERLKDHSAWGVCNV
jgi:hypothetical protein